MEYIFPQSKLNNLLVNKLKEIIQYKILLNQLILHIQQKYIFIILINIGYHEYFKEIYMINNHHSEILMKINLILQSNYVIENR